MTKREIDYELVADLVNKIQEKMPECPPEVCKQLAKIFIDSVHEILLDQGQVNVTDQIKLKIVPIKARTHTLRGIKYESKRLYKLRPSLEQELYQQIEDEYLKFRAVE